MTTFVFDLDDTLYSLKPVFEKALLEFLGNHKFDIDAFYTIYREEGLKLYDASQNGEITQDELHCYRTMQAFERVGIVLNEEQAMTFHDFYASFKKDINLDELTIYTLNVLKNRNINMGIITNGNPVKQNKTMDSLNINDFFDKDSILISGDIGVEKPDPKIFKHWEKLNNTSNTIVYIGDNFEKDVVGAHNAGWIPVWYNPGDLDAPRSDFEFYEISSLPELLVLPLFDNDEKNLNYH